MTARAAEAAGVAAGAETKEGTKERKKRPGHLRQLRKENVGRNKDLKVNERLNGSRCFCATGLQQTHKKSDMEGGLKNFRLETRKQILTLIKSFCCCRRFRFFQTFVFLLPTFSFCEKYQ